MCIAAIDCYNVTVEKKKNNLKFPDYESIAKNELISPSI